MLDVILQAGGDFLKGLLGITDLENCFGHGSVGSCVSLIAGVLPWDKIFEEGFQLVRFVTRAIDAVRDFLKATEEAEHVMAEVSEVEQGIEAADEAADAAATIGDDAGGDAGDADDGGGGDSSAAGATCNSFAGATQVLMADSTTKAIDQVKVGDKVSNAEPDKSTVQQHTVTAVHVTYTDRDFDDLTVATATGAETITVTAAHIIWDVTTQQWTEAGDFRIGDQLDTPGNGRATVTASRHYTATITTYNLTINDVHTYYVTTGATAVLVHNCNTIQLKFKDGWSDSQKAAADVKVAELNKAPRTVTKVSRSGAQRSMMRSAGLDISDEQDADHIIDLQLGGEDDITNLWALDKSVNRSLGAQIAAQVRSQGLSVGDVVSQFLIG